MWLEFIIVQPGLLRCILLARCGEFTSAGETGVPKATAFRIEAAATARRGMMLNGLVTHFVRFGLS